MTPEQELKTLTLVEREKLLELHFGEHLPKVQLWWSARTIERELIAALKGEPNCYERNQAAGGIS